MEVLNKMYDGIAGLTDKIPNFEIGGLFIAIMLVIVGIFIVIALCTLGNKARKLAKTSKKISKYIAENGGIINDENVADFEAKCMEKAPEAVKESWGAFMEERFGFPSDEVSEEACFKRPKVIFAREFGVALFTALFLIATGLLFIFGVASSPLAKVLELVIYCIILGIVLNFVLILIGRANVKSCLKAFYKMQDDLDASVMLQDLKTAEPSNEILAEVAEKIDEVIANAVAEYPELDEEAEEEAEEEAVEEEVEEEIEEEIVEEEIVEELIEEEEAAQEEEVEEEVVVDEEPEAEEEVVEVLLVEDEEEPAEEVEEAPSRLAKLPMFMDYLITTDAKRSTYMSITRVLIGAYATVQDERDKAILKDSLKVMLTILLRTK